MIKISGSIYKVNFNKLKESLTYFFGMYNLNIKSRILGEELTYIDQVIEFYCYSSLDKKWDNNEENFIIDCFVKLNRKEVESFINIFTNFLEEKNIIYDFDFSELNEDGKYIEYKIGFRHSSYDNFISTYYNNDRIDI